MTDTRPVRPTHGKVWTIEDLVDLPDDGCRYEIFDGSLLVSRPPNVPHFGAATLLNRVLDRFAPEHLIASTAGLGINIDHQKTYYIPDVIVVERSALGTFKLAAEPSAVHLVVEVLSPSNERRDRELKWADYAKVGIPHYWIVDHQTRAMSVFRLDGSDARYVETAVVRLGQVWKTKDPFPLALDLAEVFA